LPLAGLARLSLLLLPGSPAGMMLSCS